jgi:hypothetical protein
MDIECAAIGNQKWTLYSYTIWTSTYFFWISHLHAMNVDVLVGWCGVAIQPTGCPAFRWKLGTTSWLRQAGLNSLSHLKSLPNNYSPMLRRSLFHQNYPSLAQANRHNERKKSGKKWYATNSKHKRVWELGTKFILTCHSHCKLRGDVGKTWWVKISIICK